jgi:hypothetical protein
MRSPDYAGWTRLGKSKMWRGHFGGQNSTMPKLPPRMTTDSQRKDAKAQMNHRDTEAQSKGRTLGFAGADGSWQFVKRETGRFSVPRCLRGSNTGSIHPSQSSPPALFSPRSEIQNNQKTNLTKTISRSFGCCPLRNLGISTRRQRLSPFPPVRFRFRVSFVSAAAYSPIFLGGYFLKVAAWAPISAASEASQAFMRWPTGSSSFGSM